MQKSVKTNRQGLAVGGHDPVAYFVAGVPAKGDPAHAYDWQGATWHFANAKNREAFIGDPSKFAPQFGGHCALGKALGVSVKGSPKRWRIEDGKLFLNKNFMAQQMHGLFAGRIRKLASRN